MVTVRLSDDSQFMNSVVAKGTQDWLTGNWSADKYMSYAVMRSNPFLRGWFDINQGYIDNREYLDSNDMSWRDVTHPWRLPGNSSYMSGFSSTLNYVSDNVRKLYR